MTNDTHSPHDKGPQEGPQRLGKGMLVAGWVVGLAMLTLILGQWESYRLNPNQDPQTQLINGVREVTLKENVQSHYVAGGTINGQPATFLLDTGATDVVIPAGMAETMNLPGGPARMAMTANGIVEVQSTTIAELTIGDIRLHNVRASINPGMQGEGVLLGMSALSRISFTQENGKLILRQQ